MNTEQLKNRDYYVLLDKSGSMSYTEAYAPGGKTRWKSAQESISAVCRTLAEYDPDGITVVPFATTYAVYDNVGPSTVDNIFAEQSPMGGTELVAPLEYVFEDYLKKKKAGTAKLNGALVLVVTDGQPSDENAVAKSIVKFTKQLDNGDSEFGISFIQVGKDPSARDYLKRLDDNLTSEGAKFDIVDTKTMEELETVGLTEALLAALTD